MREARHFNFRHHRLSGMRQMHKTTAAKSDPDWFIQQADMLSIDEAHKCSGIMYALNVPLIENGPREVPSFGLRQLVSCMLIH
jgi:hypothetical protein